MTTVSVEHIDSAGRRVAIDPQLFAGPFAAVQSEAAVRLPGDRCLAARSAHERGVAVSSELIALLEGYASRGAPFLQASQ